MKLRTHYDLIFSFAEGQLIITWQLQRYRGTEFVGETHWSLGFAWAWPPVNYVKEES